MSWLNALGSALNVFKKTPSTETPTITEPLTPAEPVDGSTTLTLADGGTSRRKLRKHWRLIKERWPEPQTSRSDRWGMLTALQVLGGGAKCMACEQSFKTWEDGRGHECEHEKEFRRITGRPKPRGGNKKKSGSSDTSPGSPSTRPGVTTNRMGVVGDSGVDNTGASGSAPGRPGQSR